MTVNTQLAKKKKEKKKRRVFQHKKKKETIVALLHVRHCQLYKLRGIERGKEGFVCFLFLFSV